VISADKRAISGKKNSRTEWKSFSCQNNSTIVYPKKATRPLVFRSTGLIYFFLVYLIRFLNEARGGRS
jgi:hypothetical protein